MADDHDRIILGEDDAGNFYPAKPINKAINDLCIIRPIVNDNNKGHGVFVTRDISRGTRVMTEEPEMTFFNLGKFVDKNGLAKAEKLIEKKLTECTPEVNKDFWTLISAQDPGKPALSRIMNNALPTVGNGSGLFPLIARINHSCLPNCHFFYNKATSEGYIYAIRAIKKDEEVTISYQPSEGPTRLARAELQRKFGFTCRCELCVVADSLDLEVYGRIKWYFGHLKDVKIVVREPRIAVDNVYRILGLFQQCKIQDLSLADAYTHVFHTHIAHGDVARAKVFAERAHSELVAFSMEVLAANPTKDETYGMSRKWETSVEQIPTEFQPGSYKFEEWLWKRKISVLDDYPVYPPAF